ncbi:Gfo/Idh/MocA family oxidoreductase [Rhodococcus koreensis]
MRHLGEIPTVVVSGDLTRAKQYAIDNEIESASDNLDVAVASGVEAAYIGSRNDRYFDQAMAAINAGLHVLCEKPVALTSQHAHILVAAAESAGVVLATNHHLRQPSRPHRRTVAGAAGRTRRPARCPRFPRDPAPREASRLAPGGRWRCRAGPGRS